MSKSHLLKAQQFLLAKQKQELKQIAKEARENPEILQQAPHETPFGRLDEVQAARELVLCCWLPEDYGG